MTGEGRQNGIQVTTVSMPIVSKEGVWELELLVMLLKADSQDI